MAIKTHLKYTGIKRKTWISFWLHEEIIFKASIRSLRPVYFALQQLNNGCFSNDAARSHENGLRGKDAQGFSYKSFSFIISFV